MTIVGRFTVMACHQDAGVIAVVRLKRRRKEYSGSAGEESLESDEKWSGGRVVLPYWRRS